MKIRKNKQNNIKSCVCLITKTYLECDIIAFVNHYLNYCKFDHIYIFDNNTTVCNITELFKNNINVTVKYVSDEEKNKSLRFQQEFYDNFIKTPLIKDNYDYVFFIDDDEYLWINKNKYPDINSFLLELKNRHIAQFGVPWRYISYHIDNIPYFRNKSFLDECFYIIKEQDITSLKSFINPKYIKDDTTSSVHFFNNIDIHIDLNNIIDKKLIDIGKIPTNYFNNNDLILYHYYHRTIKEWNEKMNRYTLNYTTISYKTQFITHNKKLDLYNNVVGYVTYLNPFNR